MDAFFSPVRPTLILIGIWATFLLTNLAPQGNEALKMPLALIGYLAAYMLYPVAIVLGSKSVAATEAQRRFAIISMVLFVLLMLSRPYDSSSSDRVSSILALASLVSLWQCFVSAMSAAERRKRVRDRDGAPQLWVGMLLFPFLGVFYVHQRYRAVVASGDAT
jgi:phosphatidylglycerophosphate synthase